MPTRPRLAPALMLLLASALLAPAAEPSQTGPDRAGYAKGVVPFFAAHCDKCHTGDKPKGGFRLDAAKLPNDFADPAAHNKWKEVVNVLNSHEMPPKEAKQPDPQAVAAVVDWVTDQAVRAEVAKRERAVVLRRL